MGPGARPHLCADCARRLGRAEVAIRRRRSRRSAGRIRRAITCGPLRPAAAVRAHTAGDASLFKIPRSISIPASRAWRGWPRSAPPAVAQRWTAEIQSGPERIHKRLQKPSAASRARTNSRPFIAQTLDLYARVKSSDLDAEAKAGLEFELGEKIEQFQAALKDLLGLDLIAFTTGGGGAGGSVAAARRPMRLRAAFGRARTSACACTSAAQRTARSLSRDVA